MPQVRGQGLQFRRRRQMGRTRALASQQGPAPDTQPRQLSCATITVTSAMAAPRHRDQDDQVSPRVLASALDEAQVVHQHQLAHRPRIRRSWDGR